MAGLSNTEDEVLKNIAQEMVSLYKLIKEL